jgi:hypothetical protein
VSVRKSVRQRAWLGVFWALGILIGGGFAIIGATEVVQAYGNDRWFDHLRSGPVFFAAGINMAVLAGALFKRNTIEGIAAPDEPYELLPKWWWTIVYVFLGVGVFCIGIGFTADIFAPGN